MKFNFTLLLLVAVGFSPLQAQVEQLSSVLGLLSDEAEQTFIDQLNDLNDSLFTDRFDGLRFTDIDLGGAQDSLFSHINAGSMPEADSLNAFWNFNQGELDGFLQGGTLNPEDSASLSGIFFDLNGSWYENNDSLNSVLNGFPSFDPGTISGETGDGEIRWEQYQGPWVQSYRELLNNQFLPTLEEAENGGLNNLEEVANNSLFSSLFDIELAYGQEWSQVRFYRERYQTRSNAVRIASVPTYRQTLEMRWGLNASFFDNNQSASIDGTASLTEGLNPLLYSGNFALMYLPQFGSIGQQASFHLYTSVGMDLGTYVPAHVSNHSPMANNRVGKTTGFGPQIGAGFVVNYSELSFYSYGTIASGSVVNDMELDYNYDSATVNAGIRYGDAVNFLFTTGTSSWAPNGSKSTTFTRFTVGVILDRLLP